MEEREDEQGPDETGGDGPRADQPEPPAKVTLEDVSRLSPEHAPDDADA